MLSDQAISEVYGVRVPNVEGDWLTTAGHCKGLGVGGGWWTEGVVVGRGS